MVELARHRLKTRTTRILYGVAEDAWELSKSLLRAAERHGRGDYRGVSLSLTHANSVLSKIRDKVESAQVAIAPTLPTARSTEYDA